jgi:hypothetical protein
MTLNTQCSVTQTWLCSIVGAGSGLVDVAGSRDRTRLEGHSGDHDRQRSRGGADPLDGGEKLAKAVQLGLEYAPQPPFNSGHPSTADPSTIALVRQFFSAS